MKAEWGATNYLFNDQVFFLNSKSKIPDTFPDGTSNTIVTGETLKGDGKTKATDVRRQYVLLKKEDLKGDRRDSGVKYFKDNKTSPATAAPVGWTDASCRARSTAGCDPTTNGRT